jgi:hypothetical protein
MVAPPAEGGEALRRRDRAERGPACAAQPRVTALVLWERFADKQWGYGYPLFITGIRS